MYHPPSSVTVSCGAASLFVPKTLLKELGLDDSGSLTVAELPSLLRDLKLLKDNFKFQRHAELLANVIQTNYPSIVNWS